MDDFTWEAEINENTAKIVHEYFGSYNYYAVYINGKSIGNYNKLTEARQAGKEELEAKLLKKENKMTVSEKQAWLEAATNEEIIDQMKSTIVAMTKSDHIPTQVQAQEDYHLIKAEILKRMA